MSLDWKQDWIQVKGYSWNEHQCSHHLKVFYNCLVQTGSFDCGSNASWFNHQFVTCCHSVLSALDSNMIDMPKFDKCSCDQVVGIFTSCLSVAGSSNDESLLNDLNRCGLCLAVVWLLLDIPMSDIIALIKTLDKDLCKRINMDAAYLLKNLYLRYQLTKVPEVTTKFTPDPGELNLLETLHPAFSYLYFVNIYKHDQHHELVKICSEYVSKHSFDSHQEILTLLHNLKACSYAKLGKPLMAIMHWRKAVSSAKEEFFLVPLLYNLHRTYCKCGMTDPSVEMLKHLLHNVTSQRKEYGPEPWIVFRHDEARFLKLTSTKRHPITNPNNLAYYAANFYMNMGNFGAAVDWYSYHLTNISGEFDPSLSASASEFQLPIVVPPVMQITCEYALALYESEKMDDLLELDTNELSYCSSAFKRIHASAVQKLFEEEPLNVDERTSFITAGQQLCHCLSTSLFKIAALMKTDCVASKRILEQCLHAVDTVQSTKRPGKRSITEDCTDEVLLLNIDGRLCSLKGMLYFNLALMLSSLPHENDKGIISALQQALRFDSENIEMRWNVTLLLWDIGQREESIKTWCKTRNINFKLGAKEISELKNARQTEFETCQSDSKKTFLQRDISILSELLLLIS